MIIDSINYILIGKRVIKIFLRHIRSVVFYPKGALWYIQACLVGVWIIPAGIILYIFALICNSYNFLVYDTKIGKMVDLLLLIIHSARNGLFYGFFLFSWECVHLRFDVGGIITNIKTVFWLCRLYLHILLSY